MHTAPNHLSTPELDRGLTDELASPCDEGLVSAIFIRLREGERRAVTTAELSPESGIAGDRWVNDHWQKLPDGRPDPRSQVSLMNTRVLRLIARTEAAMCLAGDNLILDLDLSEANLPAGSRLQLSEGVILELTSQPHTGCAKFERRYGTAARAFVNSPHGKSLHLRGRYARTVEGGMIRVGDAVLVVRAHE